MKRAQRMPLRMKHLALYGALLGAVFGLVMQAPASWLGGCIAHLTQQRVLLLNTEGTVWQGSARWALGDGQHSWAQAQAGGGFNDDSLDSRIQWQIAPRIDFQNLGVGLHLAINTTCCTATAWQWMFTPTWQGLRIRSNDHASQWPAKWLVGLGAPWNTVQPDGQLHLQTQQFEWLQPWRVQNKQIQMHGKVELQWQQFSTRLSTLKPLGNYRVTLTGGETPPQVQLNTLEGSLQLQGQGEWREGRLRFRGEAKAQSGAEAALSNLLNVLGQRRGNSSFMELG